MRGSSSATSPRPSSGLLYETGESVGLAETARLINEAGGEAVAATADVRDDRASSRAAVATAVERFGRLDVLVANAGIASWPKTTWQASEDEWQTMMDITLTGTWNTCRAAIPAILEGGRGGAIVIVSLVRRPQAAADDRPLLGRQGRPRSG